MKKTKKIISLLLSILMIITALPLTAVNSFAADKITSGVTGDCTWSLDGTVLTISGNGKMKDYYTPWVESITKVIIENGVTSIGSSAFSGCTSLTNITIPDSVTSIGRNAFENCTSLTNITIPNSVTSIEGGAFEGCTSLTSVTIPDSVTSIGRSAFRGCTSLTSVTIPDSVTSIDRYAFIGCTSLEEINVCSDNANYSSENGVLFNKEKTELIKYPAGKTEIEYIIPDSVTSIGGSAFSSCTSLTSVTIGNRVTSIWDRAFERCTSLTEINVSSNNANYSSENGFLFNKEKTELIRYPEGKTESEYIIPDSVTSIGTDAFWGCTSLTSVTIPNSVTYIGSGAFSSCTSLTSATIGNGVTSIGMSAFENCTSLASVTIPDSVTHISWHAFYCCTSLASITIPDSVTSIDEWAFYGSTSLTSITIPDSVKSIGNAAFNNTAYYNNESNWDNGILYIGNHLIDAKYDVSGNVEIRQGTKTIADKAFYCCTSLTSVTIPESVTIIGDEAFSRCSSLTSVTIPDSVTSIGECAFENTAYYNNSSNWDNGILYIGNHLIKAKENVSGSVEIKQGTKTIADDAFRGCTSLTSVTIPDSVTSIGEWAFYGCTSLTSVTIGNGVTSIYLYAFSGCTSLTSITIPDSVTSIGGGVFSGCTSLTSITIPDSVTSIGYNAFDRCSSLTSVTIPSSITSIGSGAFSRCTSLTSITIPDSVTSIGEGAFDGCNSIKTATINSTTAVSAFSGNTSIENIIIGDSVTEIGNYAFKNCTSLTSVTIGNSVTSIGEDAFYGCRSLTSITIPDSVTYIDKKAFGYYISNNGEEKKINGFTIYGYRGSVAEKYAKDNGFEFSPMASTNELLLIAVTKMPTKTEYFIGDTLDTTGLEITAKYTDNTEKVISNGFVISGFDSSVAGKNTITVAYDSKTTTFDVEIKAPEISLSESSLSFDHVDKTATLTATAVPSDSEIVWKSSNESVATVENGVVTAKGAGNATITATITVNGIEYSAECAVDVKLPTMSFPDVRSGDWYSDAVKYNFERGYITGYSNGTFGPANNIQRQDFALILARIAGADLSAYEGQNGGFSDVPTNTYYSAAVAWAKDRGIVTGYSADNFGVGTYITREQISLILCRYLGGEVSGDVDAILNAYPDGGNTSAWAKVGVAWAVENGIVGNAGYIYPTGNAGRAEVAQIIYNMSNKGMI